MRGTGILIFVFVVVRVRNLTTFVLIVMAIMTPFPPLLMLGRGAAIVIIEPALEELMLLLASLPPSPRPAHAGNPLLNELKQILSGLPAGELPLKDQFLELGVDLSFTVSRLPPFGRILNTPGLSHNVQLLSQLANLCSSFPLAFA